MCDNKIEHKLNARHKKQKYLDDCEEQAISNVDS